MRLIDADAHVVEPGTLWRDGVEPSFAADAPAPVSKRFSDPSLQLPEDGELMARFALACGAAGLDPDDLGAALGEHEVQLRTLEWRGQPVWEGIPDGLWTRGAMGSVIHHLDALRRNFDAASTVDALRRQQVARAWMYPTAGLWVLAIDAMPPDLAVALAGAYNRWILDYCKTDPAFLRPVGTVALHRPLSLPTVVRTLHGQGFRAVTVRPNPFGGRTLGHPALAPFWATCAELGMAVAVHEGTHARVTTVGADRYNTRFARHAASHPIEQQLALLSLLEAGVLHRHPTLRVAFLEAGCGWLPAWLWRLDHLEHDQLRWEVLDTMPEAPSHYVRRQCFFGVEPDEPGIELVVDQLGAGVLLYGSDHPHVDHPPQVQRDVRALVDRLGEGEARRILWDNPTRFYADAPPA